MRVQNLQKLWFVARTPSNIKFSIHSLQEHLFQASWMRLKTYLGRLEASWSLDEASWRRRWVLHTLRVFAEVRFHAYRTCSRAGDHDRRSCAMHPMTHIREPAASNIPCLPKGLRPCSLAVEHARWPWNMLPGHGTCSLAVEDARWPWNMPIFYSHGPCSRNRTCFYAHGTYSVMFEPSWNVCMP